jgi:bis(5'-nucleosyl)-tetraphosphatase (symmetrical)
MSTYAIGDVQGCYDELQDLLALIDFCPQSDSLWFAGDMVNRGPKSLQVLRFIKSLGEKQRVVLGNHDLHLLAVANNQQAKKSGDTLQAILQAEDRDQLLAWLRQQPLLIEDTKQNYVMVHAGLPPQWDIATAKQCAIEVEAVLQGDNYIELLANMYGDQPNCWRDDLVGYQRYRFILNALTRIRFCDEDACLNLSYKYEIGRQPKNLVPWFQYRQRQSSKQKIIFGHWAALQGIADGENVFAIDTGCFWGGHLTAMRLEDQKRFSVPSRQPKSF